VEGSDEEGELAVLETAKYQKLLARIQFPDLADAAEDASHAEAAALFDSQAREAAAAWARHSLRGALRDAVAAYAEMRRDARLLERTVGRDRAATRAAVIERTYLMLRQDPRPREEIVAQLASYGIEGLGSGLTGLEWRKEQGVGRVRD